MIGLARKTEELKDHVAILARKSVGFYSYDETNTTFSFQKYRNVEFRMFFQTDFVLAAKIRHSPATSTCVRCFCISSTSSADSCSVKSLSLPRLKREEKQATMIDVEHLGISLSTHDSHRVKSALMARFRFECKCVRSVKSLRLACVFVYSRRVIARYISKHPSKLLLVSLGSTKCDN